MDIFYGYQGGLHQFLFFIFFSFFNLHNLLLFDKSISLLLSENGPEGHSSARYKVMELPISLPYQKPPPDKPNPKQGVGEFLLYLLWTNLNVACFYFSCLYTGLYPSEQ